MFELELLKNIKPKKYPITIITLIFLIILILLSYKIKTYDSLNVIAFTEQKNETCYLEILVPSQKTEILNDKRLLYKNKKYKINSIKYLERISENNILYEKIIVTSNLKCLNKIENIKLINNKQRIIKKIINTIKEG